MHIYNCHILISSLNHFFIKSFLIRSYKFLWVSFLWLLWWLSYKYTYIYLEWTQLGNTFLISLSMNCYLQKGSEIADCWWYVFLHFGRNKMLFLIFNFTNSLFECLHAVFNQKLPCAVQIARSWKDNTLHQECSVIHLILLKWSHEHEMSLTLNLFS